MKKVMTTKQTQIGIELDGNGKRLHRRAQTIEDRWRTAHGIDDKLRSKRQRKAKAKRERLERGEVRRREERKRQKVERQILARPLLKGLG